MSDLIVAFVTTNTEREASSLAQKIVQERLAACVNIVPQIRSVYEWEGEIHDEQEHLLIIKSLKTKLDQLKGFIEKHHSYEVPEFIALEVSDNLPDYLQWVRDVTS
jgi:periplasmic divalent cation tolerance protein